MKERNVIETVVYTSLTKKEFIDLINKSFTEEETNCSDQIVQIITTVMTDGTMAQSIHFGKIFNVPR